LPLELSRDVAREKGMDVDDAGFRAAMDAHRLASGAGKAFGSMGGEDVDVYRTVFENLVGQSQLSAKGVEYDPYNGLEVETPVLALFHDGEAVDAVQIGENVEVLLSKTTFYVEAGGQVSDAGSVVSVEEPRWEIRVDDMRKPAAGVIVHVGVVVKGVPRTGDAAIARVDESRRKAIMRNHTATHLLHAELHAVLGDHARQAGSLVAPDRLRFDFTHPDAISTDQLERIEALVNRAILENHHLTTVVKPLQQAISEGAMALFGEKYGETVRTISIGDEDVFSYELCGGTHVHETGDIGIFLITSEGSAAAGVRRIEAVTGQSAYDLVQRRFRALKEAAGILTTSVDDVPEKTLALVNELDKSRKQMGKLRQELVALEFERKLASVPLINGVPVLAAVLANADSDSLRQMCDRFRERYPTGAIVLGSAVDNHPFLIAAVTEDLVKRGLNAGELVKIAAQVIGGSGGGRPTLAQAGGKDASKLNEAIDQVLPFVKGKLI